MNAHIESTMEDAERLAQQVESCISIALQWADEKPQPDPKLDRLGNRAADLLADMTATGEATQQRVVMAAYLAGIDASAFTAAVHYLVHTAQLRVSHVPPIDGAQGRTKFTRFVRALDSLMDRVYGLPALPAEKVAQLCTDRLNDPRLAYDVDQLRARPYADEKGIEIGEIIPGYPPK